MRVVGARDVFEGDPSDFDDEQTGLGVERLQTRMLDLVIALHLLDEQLRVRADVHV